MKYFCIVFIAVCGLVVSIVSAQYIGEIDTVGTTWYDLQHNGSCGRMIRVDHMDNIHVVWTNGLELGATNRHVYYNMRDSTGWVWDTTGIAVESAQRAGYTCLAVDSEGFPYPAFHMVTPSTNPDAEAACARDLFYGAGAFNYWQCPFVFRGGNRLEVIWPKIAIDIDDRIHMINTENPLSGSAGDPQRIFYIGGEYDLNSMEIVWDDSQQVVEWVTTISADIAASRHSERVAFVYAGIREDIPDTVNFNKDIFLIVSEDGINWDFEDPGNQHHKISRS